MAGRQTKTTGRGRRPTGGSTPQWGKSHQNQLQKAYELIGGLMQHMGITSTGRGHGRTTTGRGRATNRTTTSKRGPKLAATG